ncbi:hypothetical protein BBJ28_00017760 [Nothophytophthora sp. Chile5]|nr:hypothetical protein BBJ28_00017760 [Nothophytophthora sp. Chile5]
MLSLHFLKSPDRRPAAWFCLKKLARGALWYFIASLTIMLVVGSLVARLYTAVTDTVKYKLEFYIANVSTHMYTTGITLVAKRIYYRETCEGRDHRSSELQKQKSSFTAASRASIKVAPLPSPADYRSPKFWPAYVRGSPKLIPALVAGAYVHILSQQRIIERGSTVLTCFIIVSTLFKLAIQEGARHYVLKKKVRSIRFMCVLVGLPTVLIDTQTRIILLGTQNTQLAALGTLGMALVEICLRGGKALFVTWSIRRREVAVQRQIPARQRQVAQQQVDGNADPSSVRASRPSISVMRLDFELWRRQLQAFHTAELNADMYAEYIAIGCSASILFFYGTHPHYSMLRVSQSSEAEAAAAATRVNQLYMLIFQFVVEVAVDYVSIVLEMTAGIEFEHTKDLGAFLAALFMVTAVLNINISATIYLS